MNAIREAHALIFEALKPLIEQGSVEKRLIAAAACISVARFILKNEGGPEFAALALRDAADNWEAADLTMQ